MSEHEKRRTYVEEYTWSEIGQIVACLSIWIIFLLGTIGGLHHLGMMMGVFK